MDDYCQSCFQIPITIEKYKNNHINHNFSLITMDSKERIPYHSGSGALAVVGWDLWGTLPVNGLQGWGIKARSLKWRQPLLRQRFLYFSSPLLFSPPLSATAVKNVSTTHRSEPKLPLPKTSRSRYSLELRIGGPRHRFPCHEKIQN